MSFAKHATVVLRTASKPLATRAFHSPFTALGASPLTSSPSKDESISRHYEKQYETSNEPKAASNGYRTYVVSEPDVTSRHYQVPAGAYPTTAPYANFHTSAAPDTHGAQPSSTSATPLAHGFTTRAATQHSGTKANEASLADRNPPPDGDVAEKFSKAGVDGAWKLRK
ncbi:hypothetical protein D9619_004560 [Psilocybe cf. subviscida]|uniref:Uncharacterized protein n=1 Tax=Psilocybe cf. subviscida TaxID=2480587 RepID=A0A8H5F835_9AGAR|nr:hypothetical protein D9619_004560 [Psilocybe cf. subviscida]